VPVKVSIAHAKFDPARKKAVDRGRHKVRNVLRPQYDRRAIVSGVDAQQPTVGLAVESGPGAGSAYWLTVAMIGAYAAAGLVILPFARQPGPIVPGLSTFFAAGVFVTELSTAFLLFVRARDNRAVSQLTLACAYLYSALMAVPYLLTFPDAILRDASVLGTSQSTAWIFICWICGFAFLTLISVLLEARFPELEVARASNALSTAPACVVGAVGAQGVRGVMRPG
jgi:hypothetical protein